MHRCDVLHTAGCEAVRMNCGAVLPLWPQYLEPSMMPDLRLDLRLNREASALFAYGSATLTYTPIGYNIPDGGIQMQTNREDPGGSAAQQDTKSSQEECECTRTKERSPEEFRRLTNRLSRIEGQIRGIQSMLEKNSYCPDILNQVAAASAALNAFGRELLSSHIRSCVIEDVRAGKPDAAEELITTLQKFMK